MPIKLKHQQKTFLRTFIFYGMHVWILIFICNVVIFYSIRFFIKASTTQQENPQSPVQVSEIPMAAQDIPSPVPTAAGPVVGISLSLPGIGTNGGNLKPLHPEREVTINLYDSDSNTKDKNVKPVHSVKAQAFYDDDPNSLTYTHFVNKYVDLGAVENGNYQIILKTDQALDQLILLPSNKEAGGQIFELQEKRFHEIPSQKMITGDIYPPPSGDNIMDINDYNLLVNCFSTKIKSTGCENGDMSDLDDNSIIDGIDYNIMLLNFRTLLLKGLPVPSVNISPTQKPTATKSPDSSPTPKAKNTSSPVPTDTKTSSTSGETSQNPLSGIITFMFLFLIIGGIGFAVYKFHILRILLPKKSNGQNPPPSEEEVGEPQDLADDPDVIEKSGYLKKVSVDDRQNGIWVTIADDSGVINGFYPGKDLSDGFVKVKGVMKQDPSNNQYMYITEIKAET